MELNLNCDLGEKSYHYSGHNDEALLKIVNTANIACGYHAGNKGIISKTIKIAKLNKVSIGAHPGFKDKKNFGRKKLILSDGSKVFVYYLLNLVHIKDCYLLHITHT